jgi:transposase-like protein
MGKRTYSSEFKLQVVLEALQAEGTDAEVARAYDVHPVTLSNWKTKLKENGSKAFGGSDELREKKKKIAKLERMIGQKEVEIALLSRRRSGLGES